MKRLVLFLVSFLGLTAGLAACAPNELPSAPPKGDTRVVKIDKTNCETSGPLTLTPDASGFYPVIRIAPRADQFCAIVLPVEESSLELISSGKKLYEYRRSHPSDKISHVVFFNTKSQEIAAIAEVGETIGGPPQEIAMSTWLDSGEKLENVIGYFGERKFGFAIALRNFQMLTEPLSLAKAHELDPKFQRPYGYLFLDRHPVVESEVRRRILETSR